jgi:hypothetical protein
MEHRFDEAALRGATLAGRSSSGSTMPTERGDAGRRMVRCSIYYQNPHDGLRSGADVEPAHRITAASLGNLPRNCCRKNHMPEFEIALYTGMVPSEQYGLEWSRVDPARNLVSLSKTKTGEARYSPEYRCGGGV